MRELLPEIITAAGIGGVFVGCWLNWGPGWAALAAGVLTIALGLALAACDARRSRPGKAEG